MKYNWNKEEIEKAVLSSVSYSEVLRKLNIPVLGNNSDTLKKKIKEFNIDVSHFTFRSYKKGSEHNTYVPVSEYLGTDKLISSHKLKDKLLKEGLKENKCELCGINSWRDKPIVLLLHHINGNHNDNSLENLQLLCPNCHSQTDNFCGNANEKQIYYCPDCGNEMSRGAKYCKICTAKHRRKVERPDKEELIKKFKEIKSLSAIAREYNVSDKTISKWFIYYGFPGKASELKKLNI